MKSKFLGALAITSAITGAGGCEPDQRPTPTTEVVETQPEPVMTAEEIRQECIGQLGLRLTQRDPRQGLINIEGIADVVNSVCNGENVRLVVDSDGDGYADRVDCEPNDESRHPMAEEVCDGTDNNCDGVIDNIVNGGPAQTFYRDADGDGFIDLETDTVIACVQPEGYTEHNYRPRDCDDSNAAVNTSALDYPLEGTELNGVDDNCSGVADGGYKEEVPRNIPIDIEGVTIGGILNQPYGCDTLRCAGFELNKYLNGGARNRSNTRNTNLNRIEALIYSDNELTRALLGPTVDANVRVFLALSNPDAAYLNYMLTQLNSMLEYARNVDLDAEQAYFDNLAEDEKDDFIFFGPEVVDRTNENIDPMREYHAMVFRRLKAGADRDIIIWGLERAITRFEEARR